MAEYYATFQNDQYLMHYGVKGQKWGQRNYQNKDGSLTPAGREHYGYGAKREYGSTKDIANRIGKGASKVTNAVGKGLSFVGKKAADGIKAKAHEINENRKENAAIRKEQKMQKKELDREFRKTFSKDTRSMTNEELKTYTERLVAEKRYLDALKDYKKTDNPFGPLIEEGRKKATTLIAEAADKALRKALDDKYGLGLSGTDKNKDTNKNKNNEQEDTRSLMQIVKDAQKKGVGNLSDKEYDKYEKARGKLYKEGILEKPDKTEKTEQPKKTVVIDKTSKPDKQQEPKQTQNKGSLMQIYKDGLKKGGMNMTGNEYKQWQNARNTLSQMGVDVKSLNPKSQQKTQTDEKIMRYINRASTTKVSSIYRPEDDTFNKQMSARRSYADNRRNLDAIRSWKIQQNKRIKQKEAIERKVDQYINWADVSF